MTVLRVGTRGSDLALWQANWVCRLLREFDSSIDARPVVIKTRGDELPDVPPGPALPVGAFVSALEAALLEHSVDLAVHSLKDLQTHPTDGLCVAAVPERGAVHDVLLTKGPRSLDALPTGARIGSGSPRRAAQLRHLGEFEVVPIRGNVPTRIAKLGSERLDGIVLAAAGLDRLGIEHPHRIDVPIEQILPAPGQGALAIQTRVDSPIADLAALLDHAPTRAAVTAERALLREVGTGCHAPVGAFATVNDASVSLHGRIFTSDHANLAEGMEQGSDPDEVGVRLARRLARELGI